MQTGAGHFPPSAQRPGDRPALLFCGANGRGSGSKGQVEPFYRPAPENGRVGQAAGNAGPRWMKRVPVYTIRAAKEPDTDVVRLIVQHFRRT